MSVLEQLKYAYATEADYFFGWCEENLEHSVDVFAGTPVIWEQWQRDWFEELLSVREDGSIYWTLAGLVVGRKNGKTAMLAAYALYRFFEDDGKPEILLAASNDKQAGRLFEQIIDFLRRNPGLDEQVHRREHIGEIVHVATGAKIIRLPSTGGSLDGYNPSLVVADELHAWTTPTRERVWESLTTGGGARTKTQVVTITTAGDAADRHTSVLGQFIDRNEENGDLDKATPGLTIARNHKGRTLLFNYSAPTTDPRNVTAMKLANPASWITEEFLARQAEALPAPAVLQLHGCVWAESFGAWIKAEWWDACEKLGASIPAKSRVMVGVDVGLNHDATAVVVAWLNEKGKVVLECRTWTPGVNVESVSLADVEDHIRGLGKRYRVAEVVYDRRFFERSAEILSGERMTMVQLEQNSAAMAGAYQDFYQAVVEGRIVHPGDHDLSAHVLSTAAEKTDNGWKVRKLRQSQRIDALVAAAMAHYRCRVSQKIEPQWAFA